MNDSRMRGLGAALLLAFVLLPATSAWSTDAAGIYGALRDMKPSGTTVAAENLVIERDVFTMTFEQGTFHLLEPVAGREVGAVFLGDGSLTLHPADPRERHHMRLLMNDRKAGSFGDRFGKMLLLFADGTADEIRAGGTVSEGGAPAGDAQGFHDHCLKREHKEFRTNFRLRLLQDLLNLDAGETGVFMAFVHFKNNPESLIAVDPMGADNLWIGDNVGFGVDGPEESSMFFMGDNNYGYSYLSHRREEIASGKWRNCRRKHLADARHYTIETRIRGNLQVEGDTTLELTVVQPGLRVLPLRLMGELRILEAALMTGNGAAQPLFVVQEEPYPDYGSIGEAESSDAGVVFPEPLKKGQTVKVRIRYAGKEVLEDAGDDNYFVGSRTSWYPNLGVFADRATYDLTFRIPDGYDIVSVGSKTSESLGEGEKVSKWRSELPLTVAGFNFGKFRVFEETDDVSGVAIQVYTNPGTPNIVKALDAMMRRRNRSEEQQFVDANTAGEGYIPGMQATQSSFGVSTTSLAQSAMADGLNSAKLFHTYFGPLESDHVALTQQSNWAFGQSWPSLIYLPYMAFISSTERAKLFEGNARAMSSLTDFVDQVGIHEMAHQWWGHLVGNESYRDTWLSEGFAEFSTGFALERIQGQEAANKFWAKAQRDINETSSGSGSWKNWETGSVTQGSRLFTRESPRAYGPIVYSKGGFVLHMLRMLMRDTKSQDPDARFFAMMQDFVETYRGKNPSTADFQAMVQKHMFGGLDARGDGKIDWFFDQWVYGTEVPEYKVDMTIEKAGKGKYRINGTVSQSGVSDDFMAMVPIYLDLGKGRLGMIGRAPFKGNMTQKIDRTLELPGKPKRVLANANYEVLSR